MLVLILVCKKKKKIDVSGGANMAALIGWSFTLVQIKAYTMYCSVDVSKWTTSSNVLRLYVRQRWQCCCN